MSELCFLGLILDLLLDALSFNRLLESRITRKGNGKPSPLSTSFERTRFVEYFVLMYVCLDVDVALHLLGRYSVQSNLGYSPGTFGDA